MSDKLTDIDIYLDAVLKASGSALRYYTTPKVLAEMRETMRSIEAAILKNHQTAATTPQPTMPASDHHRTIAKWLNEEQTGPIDRVALAHVLGAAMKGKP